MDAAKPPAARRACSRLARTARCGRCRALYAARTRGGDPAIWTICLWPSEHPDQMRRLREWREADDPSSRAGGAAMSRRRARASAHHDGVCVIEIGNLVRHAAAAHHRRDRGHLPALPPRLRRPRLPPARVEVQRAERCVTARRRAFWLSLRGRLSQPHGGQGPKPGHRLVRDHGRRVAGNSARLRGVARSGTRTRLPPEAVVGEVMDEARR